MLSKKFEVVLSFLCPRETRFREVVSITPLVAQVKRRLERTIQLRGSCQRPRFRGSPPGYSPLLLEMLPKATPCSVVR